MSADKQAFLDQITADVLQNNVCPDLAKTATNLVMGAGSPDADVMFIGEAPGKNEDLQGLPFVGAAGKFLNEMLENVGLKREDVFITSILKYRPPNNRDPLPEEKQAFWPYLLRQMKVIEPRLVVTLGRHSMEFFLPGKKISQIHGEPKRIKLSDGTRLTVLPMFHPAAALYNNSMRAPLLDDFSRIPRTLELLEQERS